MTMIQWVGLNVVKFAYIFPNDNVEAADVALKVMEIARA